MKISPGAAPIEPQTKVALPASDCLRFVWTLHIPGEQPDATVLHIGTNQESPPPELFSLRNGRALVGVEQSVFVVDELSGRVLASVHDASDVVSIRALRDAKALVLATDQLLCYDSDGTLLWRQVFPNVIDDVTEDGERLIVVDSSGEEYSISLRTGRAQA